MPDIERQTVAIAVDGKTAVSAVIALPAGARRTKRDCIVWAHGAGSDMNHPFISHFHEAIARTGRLSVKFNFLYKEQGRKAPDSAGKLETTFERVLDFVRDHKELNPSRLFLGGKSM